MNTQRTFSIRRGDIYYADLVGACGSEQGGLRPVLVIQNNVGNRYSPTIIVAMITGKLKSQHLPTHISLEENSCGLSKASMVMLEQIRTLDRGRLETYVGYVGSRKMREINIALGVSIGIDKIS